MRSTKAHFTGTRRPTIIATLFLFATVLCGQAVAEVGQLDGLPQGARDALKSTFGLTDAELESRIALEQVALEQHSILTQALGSSYAGSWIDDKSSALVVATTDPGKTSVIDSVGALPVVHKYSMRELEQTMQSLNEGFGGELTGAIASWHVDVRANQVVITILPQRTGEAVDAIARTRASLDMLHIEHTMERPRTLTNIFGGGQYKNAAGHSCSVGFAVNGGFVTAGHCGDQNEAAYTASNALLGTFAQSNFPGTDMAYVATNAGFSPQPSMLTYVGGTLAVAGSSVAPIGSFVCRSGFRTQWQCGKIENRPVSVNYSNGGIVHGLTETSACSYLGDSGGPFISASSQGQGVTSGRSTTGCTTYFQPLNPILSAYNRTLSTAGGSVSGSAPQITSFVCPDSSGAGAGRYRCWVQYNGSGQTSISWIVNGIYIHGSANNQVLRQTCPFDSQQIVTVKVSNLFGSVTQQSIFNCPGFIIVP